MEDEIKKAIRGIALQNASEHEGKTRNDAIIPKILGSRPDLRSKEVTQDQTGLSSCSPVVGMYICKVVHFARLEIENVWLY